MQSEGNAAIDSPSPTARPTATSAPVTLRTLSFSLNAQLGFTAHGTVRVEIQESGYSLSVTVSDLVPNRVHIVNMHAGSCAHEETSVIFDLGGRATDFGNRLTPDSAGNATLTQHLPGKYAIPAEGRILTVHGPFNSGERFSHIACADLTN